MIKMSEMRSWRQVRDDMVRGMTSLERSRWDKAVKRARTRYISEIRKYRGIDRIRAMYRARRR